MKPININNVHKFKKKKKIQKKIKMNSHFERPYNKLKNVTSKLKILKSKLETLQTLKTSQFYV